MASTASKGIPPGDRRLLVELSLLSGHFGHRRGTVEIQGVSKRDLGVVLKPSNHEPEHVRGYFHKSMSNNAIKDCGGRQKRNRKPNRDVLIGNHEPSRASLPENDPPVHEQALNTQIGLLATPLTSEPLPACPG